ncbi:hypothetical protein [Halomonas denitrificans]|nr:hypothetical protein [Halomonas denitrificans]
MMSNRTLLPLALLSLLLAGCGSGDDSGSASSAPEPAPMDAATADEPTAGESTTAEAMDDDGMANGSTTDEAGGRLAAILADQPEEVRARYDARNPQETLEFFGIEPGMTVVEALPGGGWYTRILLPYLGADGTLIGANYPITLFEQFEFATEEFLAELAGWAEAFPAQAGGWCEDDCATVRAYWMGDLPEDLRGTADAVLYIRALHNMARFQNEGIDDYLDQAFADAFAVLKPGGVMGVVQHAAGEDMPAAWASGEAGYLKPSFVIAQAEAAGFELEAESDINANPADKPTAEDIVWRLAPSLGTTEEGTEARAEMEAIGESNRMTLKFRKPE